MDVAAEGMHGTRLEMIEGLGHGDESLPTTRDYVRQSAKVPGIKTRSGPLPNSS